MDSIAETPVLIKKIVYAYGWLFVRPRRWLFWKMIWNTRPAWIPKKNEYYIKGCTKKFIMPNIHWWVLYETVFRFCSWLDWDAWRRFCDWSGGYRRTFPWYARLIKRIGETTSGYAQHGGECYHCGFRSGDQVDLAEDETGTVFILENEGTTYTQDGDDHWFKGTTICPICGHRQHYGDSSL